MEQRYIKKLINTDFPDFGPITQNSVDRTVEMSHRFRGSARMAVGKITIDRKHEARRKKALDTPLP